MSLFASLFNVRTNNPHPNTEAGLAMVLTVSNPGGIDANGTPVAGELEPGHFVTMTSAGLAQLGESTSILTAHPQLIFCVVDGDQDYDASYTESVTCVHGGARIRTDKYVAGTYVVGAPVKVGRAGAAGNDGLIATMEASNDDDQIVGFVGPEGLHADGYVDIILVQSVGQGVQN